MNPKVFVVDKDNYLATHEALRDIFFMYYSMFDYNGFGHNLECGKFDPFQFLKIETKDDGYVSKTEIDILQKGSVIKILSEVSDYLDDFSLTKLEKDIKKPWWTLLKSGELNHLPKAEAAMHEAFNNYDEFQKQLKIVYRDYVLKLYSKLQNG